MFRLAKGRLLQLRLHAVNQAGLVWGLFTGMTPEQIAQFVATGSTDEAEPERIPYSPEIMQQLQARM